MPSIFARPSAPTATSPVPIGGTSSSKRRPRKGFSAFLSRAPQPPSPTPIVLDCAQSTRSRSSATSASTSRVGQGSFVSKSGGKGGDAVIGAELSAVNANEKIPMLVTGETEGLRVVIGQEGGRPAVEAVRPFAASTSVHTTMPSWTPRILPSTSSGLGSRSALAAATAEGGPMPTLGSAIRLDRQPFEPARSSTFGPLNPLHRGSPHGETQHQVESRLVGEQHHERMLHRAHPDPDHELALPASTSSATISSYRPPPRVPSRASMRSTTRRLSRRLSIDGLLSSLRRKHEGQDGKVDVRRWSHVKVTEKGSTPHGPNAVPPAGGIGAGGPGVAAKVAQRNSRASAA